MSKEEKEAVFNKENNKKILELLKMLQYEISLSNFCMKYQ